MRLIDADALWRNAPNAYADCFEDCSRCTKLDNGDLYELIVKQPTVDAVAVVRCEECKHRFVDGENVRFNCCELNHNKVQADDWFCADGERRSE